MRRPAALLGLLPAVAAAQDGQSTALAMSGCAVADGISFLEDGHVLSVRSGHCSPADPVPTSAKVFRQAIVENGCSMDVDAARETLRDCE